MSETASHVPLYRIENPSKTDGRPPDGVTSHQELTGQWFTPDLPTATNYLRKATEPTSSRESGAVDGAQLVVAQVPVSELAGYHVSQHEIAKKMDVENNNYIVPRDGSVPTEVLPLDGVLGKGTPDDLRGQLGKFDQLTEARERVEALVGAHLGQTVAQAAEVSVSPVG